MFGLAIIAAVLAVMGYGSLWVAAGWPWSGDLWPMVAGAGVGYRQVSAAGLSTVSVSSTGQAVQVNTEPGRSITVRWSSYGAPKAALSMVREGSRELISFHPPAGVFWSWSLFRQPVAVLDVSLPPQMSLYSTARTGSLRVTGSYRQLSAAVSSGTINLVQVTTGGLQAEVGFGAIGVKDGVVTGPLLLAVRTGAVGFTGDPGTDAQISDAMGGIDLNLDPTARLAATVNVGIGSLTTAGFPGLKGAQHSGVFRGTIGQGTSGSLTVTDKLGAITISAYRP